MTSPIFEPLETRRLLSVTPDSVLTRANRQWFTDHLRSSSIRNTLESKLRSNDVAGFDQSLLDYMRTRTNAHFFFDESNAANIGSYIISNVGDGDAIGRANDLLNHRLPAEGNETSYSYQAGANIDWVRAGGNTETLHAINRQAFWADLSEAYRFTGSADYVNELMGELAGWSAAFPTMGTPSQWSKADRRDWTLDMSVRGDQWTWSYFQVLDSDAWTKEANSLFLYKMQQQIQYLGSNSLTYPLTDNRSLFLASTWLTTAEMFPEFKVSDTTAARNAAFAAFDGQYYADGSYREQAPGYQNNGIENMLELKLLDAKNGVNWPSKRTHQLIGAMDAYYQLLTPDGARPAMGDTYRDTSATTFLKADVILGVQRWAPAKPRGRDVWLLGTDIAAANAGNSIFPQLSDRGRTYASKISGNYVMRSDGADVNARQILFNAGPKGGQHGHPAPLNFELFGYGKPLISDPGLVRYDNSVERKFAVSTPAHNTISADNRNVADMSDFGSTGTRDVVVDQWTLGRGYTQVTAHHYGYDYLTGSPIVSRSMWFDNDGTMLVLDLAQGSAAHTYTTSFLVPGQNKDFDLAAGWFESTNPGGGNVKIQSLLRRGQTANRQTKFVSNDPVLFELDPAQRFTISQNGTFVAFATLITAYGGTEAPNITAKWITTNPKPGQPIRLQLVKDGMPQTIIFDPPIQHLPANGQNNGTSGDIAYDHAGNLHMVWYDRDRQVLKYAMKDKDDGSWTPTETIDDGYLTGSNPSIAIDDVNGVGVAYTDGDAGDLKYAYSDGSHWDVETVDRKGSTGHYPSLAFSRAGDPAIAYYDRTNGDLRLASASRSGWTIATLDQGSVGAGDVGRFADLLLDPARPKKTAWAIAYEDSSAGNTMYAVQGNLPGGAFNPTTGYTYFRVDHSAGGYISLAFDTSNRPAISHYDAAHGDLRFAKSRGTSAAGPIRFSAQTVASHGTVGACSTLYYDDGEANILYFDKSHNALARARQTDIGWTITNLADGGRELHVARYDNALAYTNLDDRSLQVLFE